MAKPQVSVLKRRREQAKRERMQLKNERRAERKREKEREQNSVATGVAPVAD